MIEQVVQVKKRLQFIIRVLARIIISVDKGDRAKVGEMLPPSRVQRAWRVIDIITAMEVIKYVNKLQSLDPYLSDRIWQIQGRIWKRLPWILGVKVLQVLLSHQRLVKLITFKSHDEGHSRSASTLDSPGTLACKKICLQHLSGPVEVNNCLSQDQQADWDCSWLWKGQMCSCSNGGCFQP